MPSTIDTDVYRPAPAGVGPRSDVLTLGWTGSHTSVRYLEALRPALTDLARKTRLRLRVVGARFACDGVEIEELPWRAESEVADLLPIDVGLMPLPDEEWVKGKCSFKALQYMALAIPVVLSPVGMNVEVVADGGNGLFATTSAEWMEKISRLAAKSELRKRLGEAGRQTVEARYSARAQAPRVAAVLRRAAARPDSGP